MFSLGLGCFGGRYVFFVFFCLIFLVIFILFVFVRVYFVIVWRVVWVDDEFRVMLGDFVVGLVRDEVYIFLFFVKLIVFIVGICFFFLLFLLFIGVCVCFDLFLLIVVFWFISIWWLWWVLVCDVFFFEWEGISVKLCVKIYFLLCEDDICISGGGGFSVCWWLVKLFGGVVFCCGCNLVWLIIWLLDESGRFCGFIGLVILGMWFVEDVGIRGNIEKMLMVFLE